MNITWMINVLLHYYMQLLSLFPLFQMEIIIAWDIPRRSCGSYTSECMILFLWIAVWFIAISNGSGIFPWYYAPINVFVTSKILIATDESIILVINSENKKKITFEFLFIYLILDRRVRFFSVRVQLSKLHYF